MTTRDCPLGGRCHHDCRDICRGWDDVAQTIADGQEQPVEPAELA